MLKVMLINANGYYGLSDYPFPRLVAIRKCDEEEARCADRNKTGLVRMTLKAICEAAPEWTPPGFLEKDSYEHPGYLTRRPLRRR